jgi:hypothetical protein
MPALVSSELYDPQPECWSPSPESVGPEGKEVQNRIKEIQIHRSQRAALQALPETDVGNFGYQIVPFTVDLTVRVRYKMVGEMQPLPYALDE